MNHSLQEIAHLFLSAQGEMGMPPEPPSLSAEFDPEQIFCLDHFFPNRQQWVLIGQCHQLCRAIIAGMLSKKLVENPSALLQRFAHGLSCQEEITSIENLIETAVRPWREILEKEAVHFTESISDLHAEITADTPLIQELLGHLIQNSLEGLKKVQGRPRQLSLRVDVSEKDLFLTVRDTGPGVPFDALPRLLFPFYGSGTGLGLVWVCQILQLHRGQIKFWSRPDTGTEVYLRLPRK